MGPAWERKQRHEAKGSPTATLVPTQGPIHRTSLLMYSLSAAVVRNRGGTKGRRQRQNLFGGQRDPQGQREDDVRARIEAFLWEWRMSSRAKVPSSAFRHAPAPSNEGQKETSLQPGSSSFAPLEVFEPTPKQLVLVTAEDMDLHWADP